MPKITYNDREDTFVPVPAGDYILGVEAAEIKFSKSSGNEQVEVKCRILTVRPDGSVSHGPLVFDYLLFDEKMGWKFDMFMKAIRKAPKKGTEIEVNEQWLKDTVVGSLGWAAISIDEHNGKKRNKIVRWITSGKDNPYDCITFELPKTKKEELPF